MRRASPSLPAIAAARTCWPPAPWHVPLSRTPPDIYRCARAPLPSLPTCSPPPFHASPPFPPSPGACLARCPVPAALPSQPAAPQLSLSISSRSLHGPQHPSVHPFHSSELPPSLLSGLPPSPPLCKQSSPPGCFPGPSLRPLYSQPPTAPAPVSHHTAAPARRAPAPPPPPTPRSSTPGAPAHLYTPRLRCLFPPGLSSPSPPPGSFPL